MITPTPVYYISAFIGIVCLAIGVLAALSPKNMSKKFGISVDGEALPYVMSTGIRDVFMGLVVLILVYLEHWTALGACHLAIGIVAISDFRVVRKHGDKKTSLVHLSGAVAVVALGLFMLFLKDI